MGLFMVGSHYSLQLLDTPVEVAGTEEEEDNSRSIGN